MKTFSSTIRNFAITRTDGKRETITFSAFLCFQDLLSPSWDMWLVAFVGAFSIVEDVYFEIFVSEFMKKKIAQRCIVTIQ